MGSKTGLILAVVGGVLYIINGVTTSVSKQALDLITSFLTMQFPASANTLVPIVQWLTGLGLGDKFYLKPKDKFYPQTQIKSNSS